MAREYKLNDMERANLVQRERLLCSFLRTATAFPYRLASLGIAWSVAEEFSALKNSPDIFGNHISVNAELRRVFYGQRQTAQKFWTTIIDAYGSGQIILPPIENVVPVVTPFIGLVEEAVVNGDEISRHLVQLKTQGVNSILVAGKTGEFDRMAADQRSKAIIAYTEMAKAAGFTVFVNITGDNDTETRQHAQEAKDAGAHYLVFAPLYTERDNGAIRGLVDQLNGFGLPVLLYNMHSDAGLSIDSALVEELFREGKIVGLRTAPERSKRSRPISTLGRRPTRAMKARSPRHWPEAPGARSALPEMFFRFLQQIVHSTDPR